MLSATQHAEDPTTEKHGRRFGIYIAFIPWVLFTLITQHDTLTAASVVALLAAVAIALPALLPGDPSSSSSALSRPSPGSLSCVHRRRVDRRVAGSLCAGDRRRAARTDRLRLAAYHAVHRAVRPRVGPARFWSSPLFVAINRQLTLMWACVFTAMIPAHIIAGAIDTRRANTIFNWVIPIVLVVWAAKRTAALSGDDQPAVAR